MPDWRIRLSIIALFLLAALVGAWLYITGGDARYSVEQVTGPVPKLAEPDKRLVPVVKIAKAVGWSGDAMPVPAAGLKVQPFADGLDHPRWMLVLPNGDVLVAETNAPATRVPGWRGIVAGMLFARAGADVPSANRITLLRDTNGDGKADVRSVLLSGLNSPFGMALVGDQLYVANTDALLRFPFTVGQTRITAPGEKVIPLPADGNHWTRNIVANEVGTRIYIAVGSASNIGEYGLDVERMRAAVLELDIKSEALRIYTAGTRNPVGLAWEPETKELWTVVNERDEIGSDLVPDYLAVAQFGGFYGWPWYYWGGYIDPRVPEPDQDMRQYTARPDYALGPHVGALGLTFASGAKLGDAFSKGAFIGLHGSWNRRPLSGYKVVFVPFAKGRPSGKPVDVLTGFLNADEQAQGRPVGVAIDAKGGLLVADDVGNRIWRVSAR